MKSISQGTSMWRIRSARKRTAPFSTPTMISSRPCVVAADLRPQLRDAALQVLSGDEGLADRGVRHAPQSRYRERLRGLGAEDAALEDGADAAAEVEDRAAAAEAGDLLGEAGGAGDRAAGGLVGEALEDEAAQGRVQLGEARVGDRPGAASAPPASSASTSESSSSASSRSSAAVRSTFSFAAGWIFSSSGIRSRRMRLRL